MGAVGNAGVWIAGRKEGGWGCVDMARAWLQRIPERCGAVRGIPCHGREVPRAWEVLGSVLRKGCAQDVRSQTQLEAAHPTFLCLCLPSPSPRPLSPFPKPLWVVMSPLGGLGVPGLLSPLRSPQDDAVWSRWPGGAGADDPVPQLRSR